MPKRKSIGIANAGHSADAYEKMPCNIGYRYLRLEVDGNILPCCVSALPLGSLQGSDFGEVWFSDAYAAFREKTAVINTEHFHLSDPEWAFCQQCPHIDINQQVAKNKACLAGKRLRK